MVTHLQKSGRPRNNYLTKTFFSLSKFLILSTDVPRRRSPLEIAARWRYRLHSNNLTGYYDSQFFGSFHLGFDQEAQKCL